MPCFHPITAYRSRERTSTGRYGITFNSTKALIEGSSFPVPCQKCQGCRVDRSREWAVRCMHEAQLYKQNCFLTLTYDDEHLPSNYSIDIRETQLFLKRLREQAKTKIRFFACGEYGDLEQRPHYHLLIFNYDFSDKILYTIKNKKRIYTSKLLTQLWPKGFSTIGSIDYSSAAYCARYTLKKVGGDLAADHYTRVHPVTGMLHQVEPEFSSSSSTGPSRGLGHDWFQKYKSDVFPCDFVVVDTKKHPVPRYYLKLLAEDELKRIKRARPTATRGNKPQTVRRRHEQTPARLRVREEVFAAKLSTSKRTLK